MPFILLFLLMAVFNRPAYIAAPITMVATAAAAWWYWFLPVNYLAAAGVKGLGVTIEIMLIVFGAIFLVAILRRLNVFEPMRYLVMTISTDKRVQAILVAWFFIGFIEGIAGFGVPTLLAIPILLAIGFRPMTAVVLALIGDSAAVLFGAVGLPITIGIAQGVGLPGTEAITLSLAVARGAALINLILSPLIPLFLILIAGYEQDRSWRSGLTAWPLAVFAGLAFMLPSFFAAYFLSPEFPTIIGALVGGGLTVAVLRLGFLLPADSKPFEPTGLNTGRQSFFKVFPPYALIVIFLLITRLPAWPVGPWLQDRVLETPALFGTVVRASVGLWYSPGLIFFLVALITGLFYRLSLRDYHQALTTTIRRISLPFIGLFFVLGIVQIILLSEYNTAGLPGMPLLIAEQLAEVGRAWPLLAPFVGVIGAFISGSSTVSNLLFSSLQYTTAETIGLSAVLILSLQAAGSAVGNMVAIHNIIAAQTVAGIRNEEGRILRRTIGPALIYALAIGLLGLLATWIFI